MPGKRDPSQTVMSISLSKSLLALVDSARIHKLRGRNRAQFIRDALAEKLASLGIDVPDDDVLAPDRATRRLAAEQEAAQVTTKKRKPKKP